MILMALFGCSKVGDRGVLDGSPESYRASVVPERDRKGGSAESEGKLRIKVLITKCVRAKVTSR